VIPFRTYIEELDFKDKKLKDELVMRPKIEKVEDKPLVCLVED